MRRPLATATVAAAVLIGSALGGCGADGSTRTSDAAGGRLGSPTAPAASADSRGRSQGQGQGQGQGPPAAKTAPTDPYAVGVRRMTVNRDGRRLRVTVWYPATGDADRAPRSGADPARGSFPVVLFSHGLTGVPADYQALLARWAAAGFVVAAPAYPNTSRGATRLDVLDVLNQPADASYVLTQVLALDGDPGDPLRGRLDTGRVGAAGHSAGGITTVGLFTLERDERLDAGIVLAGSSLGVGTGYSGPAAPLLFVHGGQDSVVSYAAGKAAYDAVPWPKAMLTLPEGDHGQSLRDTGDRAFRVVAEVTTDFLRWGLYADPAAKRRLTRSAGSDGVATLDDHL